MHKLCLEFLKQLKPQKTVKYANATDMQLKLLDRLKFFDSKQRLYWREKFKEATQEDKEKRLNHEYQFTGSVSDGTFFARLFHPNKTKNEIEVDMLHYFATADKNDEYALEYIPDKPDNVKIKLYADMVQQKNPEYLPVLENQIKEGYLNPKKVRMIALEKAQEIMEWDENNRNKKVFEMDLQSKGLPITYKLNVNFFLFQSFMSIDNVPAIKLTFWPPIAADFNTRFSRIREGEKPLWPDEKIRVEIMERGCELVPKPSPQGNHNTEWRWSFSSAETRLMNELSAEQKRSYYLAKIIFYKTANREEKVRSYWLKTTMFWVCEEHPNTDNTWKDENLLPSIKLIYEFLLAMIQERNLPHFCIPCHSLIRYATDENLSELEERIKYILNNLEKTVPTEKEYMAVINKFDVNRPWSNTAKILFVLYFIVLFNLQH